MSCALIASCVMWLLPTGDHAAREKKQQQQRESNMPIVYMSNSLHIGKYEIRMYIRSIPSYYIHIAAGVALFSYILFFLIARP